MKERRKPRKKLRIPCRLHLEDQSFQGIVLDVSPRGLFVQTTAPLPARGRLGVAFASRRGHPPFEVEARIARRRAVPARLAAVASAGVGLEVLDPPPDFVELLEGERATARARPQADPEAPPLNRYGVRGSQPGAPRSRTLTLEAANEEEARKRALEALPSGWEILEIHEL